MTAPTPLSSHDCEALYRVTDPASRLVAFIAVHSTRSGPAFGGIRRRAYPTPADAVADAVGLARQMTLKTRLAGLPCGGGKSVILDHPALDVPAAYRALGAAIEALDGAYFCGPDMGTGEEELDAVREATAHVNARGNRPSESTARGVLAALRVVLRRTGARSAFVEGLGRVGARVARGLLAEGLTVSGQDLDPAAVGAFEGLGRGREADVFAPCAAGPVVTRANVDRLPYRAICGAANTQLELDTLGDVLHRRGVLYAPDFVVNAGAVIEGALVHLTPGPDIDTRGGAAIDAIGPRLEGLLDLGRADRSPLALALEAAAEVE